MNRGVFSVDCPAHPSSCQSKPLDSWPGGSPMGFESRRVSFPRPFESPTSWLRFFAIVPGARNAASRVRGVWVRRLA